jgi:catechol 2,3-dioxygenase-like lactoylglutathione lyase family enzyme
MSINSYDHFTIRCADLQKSWRFYQDVLGVRVEKREPPPGLNPATPFPEAAIGYFADGEWFVHLFQATPEQEAVFSRMAPADADMARWRTGRMHHVSVKATGYAETMAKLRESGLSPREFTAGERHIVQIQDPDGVEIELTFRSSELA